MGVRFFGKHKKNGVQFQRLIYFIVLYEGPDKETDYRERIKVFTSNRIKQLDPWKLSPVILLKATIDFCIQESLLLDSTLVQGFIVVIQGQKIFEKYGLMASDKRYISDYILGCVQVVTVPGDGFGAPGHIRFSYATDTRIIQKGMERVKTALEKIN